jgi:hypothetical protein
LSTDPWGRHPSEDCWLAVPMPVASYSHGCRFVRAAAVQRREVIWLPTSFATAWLGRATCRRYSRAEKKCKGSSPVATFSSAGEANDVDSRFARVLAHLSSYETPARAMYEVDPIQGTRGPISWLDCGSLRPPELIKLHLVATAAGMWATRQRCSSVASCPRPCR